MTNYERKLSVTVGFVLVGALLMAPAMAQNPLPDPNELLPDQLDVPFTPITTVYTEDFAEGDGNFTVGGMNPSWAFGTPTDPPESIPGVAPDLWGTNLAGDYNNNECSYLQSPAIDLSALPVGMARLSFSHYTDIEPRWDGAIVMTSSDGVAWNVANPVGGYDDNVNSAVQNCFGIGSEQQSYTGRLQEWRDAEFDVSDNVGGDLHVRWIFASDFSITDRGWYIDDIAVQIGIGASVGLPSVPTPEDLTELVPDSVDVPFVGLTTAYSEDFAEDDGGFTVSGTTQAWEFGNPTDPPEILEGQNSNVWGTYLNANYQTNECSFLTSPAIDLSDVPVGLAYLSFEHWIHAEFSSFSMNAWDGGIVMASSDGQDFVPIDPVGGYTTEGGFPSVQNCFGVDADQGVYSSPNSPAPESDAWESAQFDVSEFVGGDLYLRFGFASDSSVQARGWYIDDLAVQVGVGASVDVPEIPLPEDPTGLLPDQISTPFVGLNTAYAEDFAEDDGGYTVGGFNPSWAFGTPTDPPESIPGVAPDLWGTNLAGNYNNNECSYLQSPAIDLSSLPVGMARLSFSHYTDIEPRFDGAIVMTSSDGVAWNVANPVGGYDDTFFSTVNSCFGIGPEQQGYTGRLQEWRDAEFDVSDHLGGDLHVRWMFASDFSITDRGWYIDDVSVVIGLGASVTLPDIPELPEDPGDLLP